jgi:hypothetical protein
LTLKKFDIDTDNLIGTQSLFLFSINQPTDEWKKKKKVNNRPTLVTDQKLRFLHGLKVCRINISENFGTTKCTAPPIIIIIILKKIRWVLERRPNTTHLTMAYFYLNMRRRSAQLGLARLG